MSQPETALLLKTLQKVLKAEKWTYKALAKELDLSEISVKRIFSSKDCSLSRLSKMCDLVGTSIIELSELAKVSSQNENYFFNDQQEKAFVDEPALLGLFLDLYRGDSAREAQARQKWSDSVFFKQLQKLEQLELLEVHPKNRVKLKVSGRLRWRLKGEFFEKVLKRQNIDFLESVYRNVESKDCCLQSSQVRLSQNTKNQMVQEIHELGRKYRSLSYQEERTLRKEDLIDVRWLIAFLPYTTDWASYENINRGRNPALPKLI